MRIEHGQDYVEILFREVAPPPAQSAGDIGINVSVSSRGFLGSNHTVWVSKEDYERFIRDLMSLESIRQGSALLESMSPEEFRLRLYASSRTGRMAVEGYVGKVFDFSGSSANSKVFYRFEIDPSQLASLLQDFERLRQST